MLRTTFKFQLRNYFFFFFGNMPSTLVKPCFERHKIPKNFSSNEEEDNAMLLDVRRETKKEKKTQNFKYNFYNFILTLYGPTTANSSPCCCTSQRYLFISSGCCCCFKMSSKQLLPFCHVFRVANTKAPPTYFSLLTTSKGKQQSKLISHQDHQPWDLTHPCCCHSL